MRTLSILDQLIVQFDHSVKTLLGPVYSERVNPSNNLDEGPLDKEVAKYSAGLMRVDHAGEVCAQALYLGHKQATKSEKMAKTMGDAAREEGDHLAWCAERLYELNSRPSFLGPVWYWGAFVMGYSAAKCGDDWGLGFVVETENQVVKHLEAHLQHLPDQDVKSRAILTLMREDELTHGDEARRLGARELPDCLCIAMKYLSKIMTTVAYFV